MSSPLVSSPLLFFPLPHICPLLPLHAAVCGCFCAMSAEEYVPVFLPDAVDFVLLSEFEERREFKMAESVTKLQQEDQPLKSKETYKMMWPSTKERLRSLSKSKESCSIFQDLSFTSVSEERCTVVSVSKHST